MDRLASLYLAAARAIDGAPVEAEELREFAAEASSMDLEGHRLEMFELSPRCPPYAGHYALGEGSRERGLYMQQILSYYRAFGLDMDVRRELPDYLPAMLEFLAATRSAGRQELRREFYRRFIAPWFPRFAQCLERAGSPYRHVARALLRAFEEDFGR